MSEHSEGIGIPRPPRFAGIAISLLSRQLGLCPLNNTFIKDRLLCLVVSEDRNYGEGPHCVCISML